MEVGKQRLEAFSDGVIAIIITIMVLSIPLPSKPDLSSLLGFLGNIFIYFISFIVVGYFWSRHHWVFSYIKVVTNKVIWYNLLLLFFLSLIPVLTKWVMDNPNLLIPAIGYDIVYISVTSTYMVIFNFAVRNTDSEEIHQIKEKRKMMAENDKKRQSFHKEIISRFLVTIVSILAIIVISVLFNFSTYVLLGLPVLFSFLNLVQENPKHKRRDPRQ